jgi:hypothetical protein
MEASYSSSVATEPGQGQGLPGEQFQPGSSTGDVLGGTSGSGFIMGDQLGATGTIPELPEDGHEEHQAHARQQGSQAQGGGQVSAQSAEYHGDTQEESGEMGETIQRWLTSQAKQTEEMSQQMTSKRLNFRASPVDSNSGAPGHGTAGSGEAAPTHFADVPIRTMASVKDEAQRIGDEEEVARRQAQSQVRELTCDGTRAV